MRSAAESGEPLLLSNCSERPPFEGVYLALIAMKPSAKFLIAVVRVLYVEEEEV